MVLDKITGVLPKEIRISRIPEGTEVLLLLERENKIQYVSFINPSNLNSFTDIFNGFDFIEISRNQEHSNNQEFGKFKIMYFKNDPYFFTVDSYEIYES